MLFHSSDWSWRLKALLTNCVQIYLESVLFSFKTQVYVLVVIFFEKKPNKNVTQIKLVSYYSIALYV